ncbi:hypothetical protein FJZ31_22915 [Candidatus Poribacteria bacterium]|nr:hypothetical protein [Candidatus Poribacteria bacterium]
MIKEISLSPTGEAILAKELVALLQPKKNKICCIQRGNILVLIADETQLDELKTFRFLGEAALEKLWKDEDDAIWKSYFFPLNFF